ncbi:hypothetical protein ACQ4M3_39390 [Leptolyngbya sp. AN03gr2]|uniref:hypothetical protein n=1 Tax=unclassified Leptolyngbya TaxID=2650499 RepID=UPI003D322E80
MQSDGSRSDWTMEVQSWDEIRQMYADAGVPLSSEQEAQYQQANERLRARIEPEFRDAPILFILRFLVMAILPKMVLDIVGGSLLGDAILGYLNTMAQILTPEQLEVWQRSFNHNQ